MRLICHTMIILLITQVIKHASTQTTCTRIPVNSGVISPDKAQYDGNDQVTITCNVGYYLSLQISTVTCIIGTWQPTPPDCVRYECSASALNYPNMLTSSTAPYYFSDTPTFLCDTHYFMSTDSTLVCSQNIWTGTAPYCADIECTPIDVADAGESLTADPLIHGEQIRISCNNGYRQEGDTDLTCDTGSGVGVLTGVIPTCIRIVCNAVSIQGGTILSSPPYYVGSEISFTCYVGYVIQGVTRSKCLNTGSFDSSPPSCLPVQCDAPSYPNMVITSPGPHYYDSGVTFQCDSGFYMSTAAYLRCDPDGNWEGLSPFCTKIQCLQPGVSYSTFTTLGPYYDGDKLGVVCDYTYSLQGADILECDASTQPGQWKEALPICDPIICTPAAISNGFYDTTSGGDGPPYLLDESIYYDCIEGYRLRGNSILVCTEDGTWDIPVPECVQSVCEPVTVASAFISTSPPYYWNSVLTYICNKGYNMTGSESLICGPNGEWAQRPPVCKRNECKPINITGGIITSEGPYYMNDKITYKCKASLHLVGTVSVTCNQHGRYSTSPPVCEKITCTPYQTINATYLQAMPFYVGDVILYHCKYGLALEGSNTLICSKGEDNSAEGMWLGKEPVCVSADLRPFTEKESRAWIAAAVLGVLLAAALLALLIWWCCCKQKHKVIKRVHHHAVQKPARQAHHKSCQCASCTKSRHHIGCNCVACAAHEKHKRHDEFCCRQCKKAYIHKAASDTCYCADCKTGRRHKLDHRCQCKSCQISHNHMAGIICDCKNCNKTVKHVETNTECNCELCLVYKEHQATKRWEHTKSCHSCRVSFEHDKQHNCTCNSCMTTTKHQNQHGCHCEDCDGADVHRLRGSCLCNSCVKMEPQIHRVKHHYEQHCQCSACIAPRHHHQQQHAKTCAGSQCKVNHCTSRSCSRADQGAFHHHTHVACSCDSCVPKLTPKPTLQHCDCSKCATAREYNHKAFCECPMCTIAHQHTHTNECQCQQCTYFLQYGGHASCVTCQDPSIPMQAMKCQDKNCRRCVMSPPVRADSPPVRAIMDRPSPRRQTEPLNDAGPKVDCWRPGDREPIRRTTHRGNGPVPLNQRPLWLPHKNDVRLDAWHRNSITN